MGSFVKIYVRQQKRHILAYLLFCLIFSIVIILYQLPVSAVLYPLLLCTVVGLGIMGIDMILTYRRYAALQRTLEAVGMELDRELLGEENSVNFRAADQERGTAGHFLTPGKKRSTSGGFLASGEKESTGEDSRMSDGKSNAREGFYVSGGEGSAEGDSRMADEEGCAWELLLELLYNRKDNDSKSGNWETCIYREMVRQLLLEQRRRQDVMRIRQQDTVDYYTTWVHQIKTPIASMGLILQQEDTEDSRRLSEELQRIEQYVDMVLTYLRLDSRDTDYVIAQVDLDRLLRGCIKKYAGQFIRRHLTLDYQGVDCRVLTDEKWLAFVVEQVLSNALKYTRSGSVSICLEPPCILCIKDTGIGIAPEDLPRIFEKGYTGYNGRSDKKATGLGLYLCRQICERLGHTITAESALGEGTVIRIGLGREVLEVE